MAIIMSQSSLSLVEHTKVPQSDIIGLDFHICYILSTTFQLVNILPKLWYQELTVPVHSISH